VLRYIGASIVITLRGYQLDIAVQPNNESIAGLLGNNNGVSSDDLISRNGQTAAADSTERTIYYEFGETCESMSPLYSALHVFTVRGSTTGWSDGFLDPSYRRACKENLMIFSHF